MPKYRVKVKQTLHVEVDVHGANVEMAKLAAVRVVNGFSKTVAAEVLEAEELGAVQR